MNISDINFVIVYYLIYRHIRNNFVYIPVNLLLHAIGNVLLQLF